jgi:hypothetical protein
MNKTCLNVEKKIVGREDKNFCSDGCRNACNNKINKDSTNYMRNINNSLVQKLSHFIWTKYRRKIHTAETCKQRDLIFVILQISFTLKQEYLLFPLWPRLHGLKNDYYTYWLKGFKYHSPKSINQRWSLNLLELAYSFVMLDTILHRSYR